MEIRLELKNDSCNSHPSDSLIITEYNDSDSDSDKIFIKLENPDREVSVNKSEFKRVMRYLIED